MKIILAAEIILSLVASFFAMCYNMHMFQLNGYKNQEHAAWLRKNERKQRLLYAGLFASLLAGLFPNPFTAALCVACTLLIVWYYRTLRLNNTKKKLVYTNRVKRLIATDICLSLILLPVVYLTGKIQGLWVYTGIVMCIQGVILLPANVINSPVEKGINQRYINDAKRLLKENDRLTVIGITGSYGKTSVKYFLNTLLQSRFNVLMTPASYNTPMGVVKTIRGSLKPAHEIFICEMGARHVGDIKEICDIVHPNHGIITSIGPQHLETFFNMDNIKSTKFELADALPKDGMLFLNGDNSYINDHIKEKGQMYGNRIFYGADFGTDRVPGALEPGKSYRASDIRLSRLGTEFKVTAPDGETEQFQMRLIGAHNVANVVGAIAVSHKLGIALKDLKVPVRRLQSVEHRMKILDKGPVTIIDDAFNSNPAGSRAAVETLAMFDGVRILITPGMVELGAEEERYNYEFGTYAAACCDYIALVGKKHTEPIRRGIQDSGFSMDKCKTVEKLEEALTWAYAVKEQEHKYILLENDLPDNY